MNLLHISAIIFLSVAVVLFSVQKSMILWNWAIVPIDRPALLPLLLDSRRLTRGLAALCLGATCRRLQSAAEQTFERFTELSTHGAVDEEVERIAEEDE